MLGTPLHVSLRDQYGNHWPMTLANIENVLYFEEGWAKFVEDNFIESGDFMIFQFDGDKVFHVKLTGLNRCDKKGVGGPLSKETIEEHWEAEIVDEEMEEQENQQLEEQSDRETEEGNDEDEETEEGDDEELEENLRLNEQVKREVAKLRKDIKSLARKIGKINSNSGRKNFVHKRAGAKRTRAKAIDPYGTDIFKSGILPLPKNPYFVTKIRPKRRKDLCIPSIVLKDHSIGNLPVQATLRDSCGRTWSTKLSRWADGRRICVGGWSSFCELNSVEDEDLCVCELLREGDQQDLVIQLQVVPISGNAMINRGDQQMA